MRRQRVRRRGDVCECCAAGLAGQGVIFLDGTRRLYLCRECTEDAWARRDAEAQVQRDVLEALWQLAPWQSGALDDGGLGVWE
jgi:hypothetical protein